MVIILGQFGEAALGGLDFLVLNHMYLMPSANTWTGSDHNLTMLRHVMDVNFHSYVQLASHALPILERSNGSLVVISSLSGEPQSHLAVSSDTNFMRLVTCSKNITFLVYTHFSIDIANINFDIYVWRSTKTIRKSLSVIPGKRVIKLNMSHLVYFEVLLLRFT